MERRWYCWLYFFANEGEFTFLYGFTAQTSLPKTTKISSSELTKGLIKIIFFMEDEEFEKLKTNLVIGYFDFKLVFQKLPEKIKPILIKSCMSEIRDCLGYTSINVSSWHSMLQPSEFSNDKEKQRIFLKELQADTGVQFTGKYAGLLGAFEILHLPNWSEDAEPPFGLLFDGQKKEINLSYMRDRFVFKRRPDFAGQRHFLVVRLYSGTYLIHCEQYQLDPDVLEFGPIVVNEHITRESYGLYDESGVLLHDEDCHFFDSMSMRFDVGGVHADVPEDPVSRQSQGLQGNILQRVKSVHIQSQSSKSISTFVKSELARSNMKEQELYVKNLFDIGTKNNAWFKNGTQESIEALLYLLEIINKTSSRKIIIADPYFDKSAFEALIPRIGIRNLPVTIISSLTIRTDRNNGKKIDDWNELIVFAENLKFDIHCKLDIYNLYKSTDMGERFFHDRYMMRYGDENDVDVYLLSNSLNVRSRNFPCCIAKLSGLAANQVQKYLEDMENPAFVDDRGYWRNYDR